MKAMRIAALGLGMLAGVAAVASAQSGGAVQSGAGTGRRPTLQLNGLELTESQKSRLAEIQRKYQPEMAAIREGMQNGGDQAEVMHKLMELRERSSTEMRAILTTEQQAVFDKNVAEMKAQMDARMRAAPVR